MKIGMFTESYLPMINGVVTSIDTLARELRSLGHEVYIITTTCKGACQDDPYVIRLKGFSVPLKCLNNFQLVEGAYKKYRETAPDIHFDVIHFHTEFSIGRVGIKVAKYNNIPLFYTFHTMYEDYGHYVIPFGLRHIGKPFFMIYVKKTIAALTSHVDCVVCPTEKVENMLKRYKIERTHEIIPTGINLDQFDKDLYSSERILEIKKKYNLENYVTLLYVGRISNEKSLDELLKMYNDSKIKEQTRLVIIGEGPYLDKLKQLSSKLKLDNNVIFMGPIKHEEIGLYYRIADVFVNASKTETQGLTFIEALASSVPVLARYDTNLNEIIYDNENGLFYYTKEEFEEKLYEIVTNSELRYRLATNARKSIEKFDSKTFAKSILKMYNRYVAK